MKKRITKQTYSKRATTIILAVALCDIQLTYVLAFMGLEIAETLAVALVTEVIGVFATYSIKAYLGKKQEEETKITREERNARNHERDWEEANK